MRFLFNLMNHSLAGQRTLEDVLEIIGRQMKALGHDATWDKSNKHLFHREHDDGYNIMFEGFTDLSIPVIAEHHAKGARFLFIATEEPSERGFNHGSDPEMAARQGAFAKAARFADGILHLVPGQHVTDWYGQFAPAAYAELGYAPSLVRIDNTEPEFDFGFFGSLSQRRLDILKRLKRANGGRPIKMVIDFPTREDRDREMRQAKIILQIRKTDQMGLVSSSRCNTSLCLGRPVIAEPHALCKPWDEVVHFSKTSESFINEAIMMRGLWRGIHAGQLERFRQKFSPEMSIGEPLRRIGILPPLEAQRAA